MKLFIAFLLCMPLIASADQADVHDIAVYRGSLKPKLIDLGSSRKLVTVRSKIPHRQLNPGGQVLEYQGINLNDLLHLRDRDRGLLVHFVGADGYVSTVPASVLLK